MNMRLVKLLAEDPGARECYRIVRRGGPRSLDEVAACYGRGSPASSEDVFEADYAELADYLGIEVEATGSDAQPAEEREWQVWRAWLGIGS